MKAPSHSCRARFKRQPGSQNITGYDYSGFKKMILRYVNTGSRRFGERPYLPFARLCWEFYAVVDGSCGMLLEGNEKLPLKQSHFWLLPPNFIHGWYGLPRKVCNIVVIHFASIPRQLAEAVPRNGFFERSLSAAECKMLKGLEGPLEREFRKPGYLSDILFQRSLLDLTLFALAGTHARELDTVKRKANIAVDAALSWYRQNIRDGPSFEEMAKAVHMSPSHLRRMFAEVGDQTPSEAMLETRIQAAVRVLSESDAKIDVVASECGFSSASAFCRTFKINKRCTPMEWRRRFPLSEA
jgi:AraC family transcriptional regulator